MLNQNISDQLDYLVIGHLSCDLPPGTDHHSHNGNPIPGARLGGTAAYASLTARAMGLRTGIVTAVGDDISLDPLSGISIAGIDTDKSTSFENIMTPKGRIQKIHHIAPIISPYFVPQGWRNTPVVHLGPIVHEIDLDIIRLFPDSFIGITPQGWLRQWNKDGLVRPDYWLEARFVLEKTNAAIISQEDAAFNPTIIEEMAMYVPILVVTKAAEGADIYQDGDIIHVPTQAVVEVGPVGAGDIFAAIFFIHLQRTHNPIEAAQLAASLASISVTRSGLQSIPTREEVYTTLEMVI